VRVGKRGVKKIKGRPDSKRSADRLCKNKIRCGGWGGQGGGKTPVKKRKTSKERGREAYDQGKRPKLKHPITKKGDRIRVL